MQLPIYFNACRKSRQSSTTKTKFPTIPQSTDYTCMEACLFLFFRFFPDLKIIVYWYIVHTKKKVFLSPPKKTILLHKGSITKARWPYDCCFSLSLLSCYTLMLCIVWISSRLTSKCCSLEVTANWGSNLIKTTAGISTPVSREGRHYSISQKQKRKVYRS